MPTQPYLKSNLGWFNLVFFRSFQSIRDSEIESKLRLHRLKENWDKTPTTTNPLGLAAKILRICIADLIFIACLATVFCLCSYWSPMLTKDVIRAMEDSVSSPMLVVLLAISLAGLYLSLNHIFMRSFFLGYKAKYLVRRVLIVTQSQNETATLSGVLLESERIFRGFYALGLLIPSIASIAIAIILLQNFVGIGAWLGFVILCVLVGYSRSLARISAKRLEQTSKKYREKLSYVQFLSNNLLGVLLGSQLDRVFHDIRAKRREECEALISYSRSIVALQALFLFLPAIVIFVVLISAGLLHQKLTVATLFPSLLLLGTLRSAVGVLPSCYVSLVQGFHALKEVSQIFAIESERTQSKEVLQFDIQNRWITASKESDIIPAWLQQLPCEVKPAEISHDPWLFVGTLEQNVALGLNIDKARIREILHFLNLTQELSIDDAENFQISKNGYNLSGGQRQRVALARIIYQDPEVILLDDGLSSIDPVLREAILMGLIDRWQGKIVLYLTGRPEEHACGSFSFCADTKRLLVNDFRPKSLHKSPSLKIDLPSQDPAPSAGSDEPSSISIKNFVREFSGIFILSVIMMFSLRELLSIGLDLWLKNGAESGNIATHSAQFFLVYGALVLSVAATNLFLFKHIIMKILLTNESAGERLLKYFHQMVRINGSKSIGKLNFGRLVYDQQVVDQSFGSKTLEVLSCIAQLIALCLFTVATSPKLFVGMAILFAIFCYLLFDYRRRFQKLAFERSEYNNQLLTRFSEWQKGRRLLTCLKQASSWRQQFLIPVIYGSDQSAIRAAALERWISIQAESIGIAMVIGISLIGMKTSTFAGASGIFAICLSYCQQMITSLGRFMRFTVDWDQDLVSFNRLIETSREVYDNDATLRAENSEEAQHGDLEVKELTFRHEGRDRLIFSDASLNVRSGDRVAIIGPTGAGKSTLLQIFRGILPVTRGHLRLGSIWTDLTHEMPNSTNICIVEQAATVYPGPIKELFSGISYGEAKKTCGDLGLKLTQTAFEETPEFLSAIERQQVMLASAVHHQAKVIILDEPTAALADQQAFETIAIFLSKVPQKTVLMITHQPQLLQLCHETYHLENGTFRASSVRNEYAST